MHREHGTEITFAVHPRPVAFGASDAPAPAQAGHVPTNLPPGFAAAPRGTAAEDVSRHRDTPAGDLAFLARFAFGRY